MMIGQLGWEKISFSILPGLLTEIPLVLEFLFSHCQDQVVSHLLPVSYKIGVRYVLNSLVLFTLLGLLRVNSCVFVTVCKSLIFIESLILCKFSRPSSL